MSRRLQILGELGADAVRYVKQDLNEGQREQARDNIGVDDNMLSVLVAMSIAPVLIDNDAVLADSDGAILLNI